MALTLTITGKEFPEIGNVGESAGFVDFTPAEKELDTYAKIGLKEFEVDAATVLAGETTDNGGKAAIVADVETQATAYVNGIFTDGTKTYTAKVYILSAKRRCQPDSTLSPNDYTTGNYVPYEDIMDIQTRIEILVA